MKIFRELWDYREMLSSLVKKDLKTRYKGSALGFFWTFLNPLFQLLVYTLLFSVIMPQGIENYAMFLFVALVPWLFLSTSLTTGCRCILDSSSLILKIYFPRMIIPISVVCSALVNMAFSFIVVFVMLGVTGVGFSVALFFLPVIMILEFLFVLGLTLIVSALNVFFRDLEYIIGILTMAWMYMTPVLYGIDRVPAALTSIFYLNPMTSIVLAYRDILFYKTIPDFSTTGITLAFAAGFIVLGIFLFSRLQKRFAEEL